ncbi:uncharacterized protein TNCV_3898951 [Trichonephila clavipes]|nr:uncharacterized protein TNCV_3898951 [Trichonephila clavipes]
MEFDNASRNKSQIKWNRAKYSLEHDARPGQAHRVITPEMIAEKNALLFGNRIISVGEIHRLLGISVGSNHTLMNQHLNFLKICAQWIPNPLTTEHFNTRIALSLSHLQRYHEEEYGFLSQIGMKHVVIILSPKASVGGIIGNVRLHQLQRNQMSYTPVLVRS